MEVSFDLECALDTIRGFVSDDIYDFCCEGMDSDLATINVDDPCSSSTLDALDAHADTLPQARLQQLEEQPAEHESKRQKLAQSGKVKRIFAKPEMEEEIAMAKLSAIPAKTLKDTSYYIGVWTD